MKHLIEDQKTFWTSPLHARPQTLKAVLPFVSYTGALIASDNWVTKQFPDSPNELKYSRQLSEAALYSLVGVAGGSYLWGHFTGNGRAQEAGILSAESAIDSTAITFALKQVTQRPRPLGSLNSAAFFRGGSSFPSEHSTMAWSIASIFAHEYPGTLSRLFAYGLASGITVSRVTAKQHFASDVFVGSVWGWYMGRQVYQTHHNSAVGGKDWISSAPSILRWEQPAKMRGSSYVPLDSWIYPAMERLAAWGYVRTNMLGQRPWTRKECVRLLEEADEGIQQDKLSNEAATIFRSLEKEFFSTENTPGNNFSLHVDSLYTRVTEVSGLPLTDGYNFAQTIVNDYGRPFQEGANTYTGLSTHGNAGPLAFYVRGEYQHVPFAAGPSDAVRQAVAGVEGVPVAPPESFAEINRARLVEGYVSLTLKDFRFSFGKQSLWWGPTESGPLLASTNSESIPMLRISTNRPFKLPSLLGWMGPIQTEFFLGQLQGHRYILTPNGILGPGRFKPQPFIHGQKISFKPTPNLEFGFSRTVVFSGAGHPFTFASFFRSFMGVGSNGTVDAKTDAGDRRSGFDFSYRLPYLRKWLTFYSDSFCDDDVSPLSAPQRCAWNPGIYLAKFPAVNKLDFRAEGVYTDVPGFHFPGTNYQNIIYRSGYTNNGNIIGSWIGRQGTGLHLSSTYWFSPQSKLEMEYRRQEVDPDFLRGGTLNDFSLRSDIPLHSNLSVSAVGQYERWHFPLLATTGKSNLEFTLQLIFRPHWHWSMR